MPCISPDPQLQQALDDARIFLNSSFVSAFLSALAGAGLGVWGAQRLAERSSRRRELRDALRQANAIVVLATTISNQALSVKKQHIAALSKTYFEQRKVAEATNDALLNGDKPERPIHFQAEMAHITPLTSPIEALKSLTYAAQLMPGRALALVAMVEQSLTQLAHAVSTRSKQIELFKTADMPMELF